MMTSYSEWLWMMTSPSERPLDDEVTFRWALDDDSTFRWALDDDVTFRRALDDNIILRMALDDVTDERTLKY